MIVRIAFDKDQDLVLLFGNTPTKKWHKYFREFVSKFKKNLPTYAYSVHMSEAKWPVTKRGFINKWLNEDHLREEYPGNYAEVGFYPIKKVEDKVNHILFKECFSK